MALRRVFVLLETGSICVYKVHNRDTATLDKLQYSKQLKDYEGKSLTQSITAMTMGSIKPPMIDCEIFSELHQYNTPKNLKADSSDEEEEERKKKSEYLSSDGDENQDLLTSNFSEE